MKADFETVVIGAGQAGLAAGYYLKRAGARFTLLDRGTQVGESWARRWDSLKLFTPAKYNSLPGYPFPDAPDSLPGKDDVVQYLQTYAQTFELPVRLGVAVSTLARTGAYFTIRTNAGEITAESVVVATGAYQRPFVPALASELSPGIAQFHSSSYRNPQQLPAGDVLVVGAANSGAQIALELSHGRRVWLSGRDTGSIPRRLFGRDIYDWLTPTIMRPPVDSFLGRRLMHGRLFTGDPLVGMRATDLERPTLTRVGRTTGVARGYPLLEDGRALDSIAAVIWSTGFRPDFSWIELPVFADSGYPIHNRGIVMAEPSLAFVGLRYQYRVGSSLLGGVGEDAEYVVASLLDKKRQAA